MAGIGVFICHCGSNIAGVVGIERVIEAARTLPGVKVSRDYKYLCSEPGQNLIINTIKEEALNRVVIGYGCLLTRPKGVCPDERIEDPQFLDNLVNSLGGESVKWNYKTECCGAAFSLTKTEIVYRLSGEILKDAKESDPDCIIVACPLCHSNLDARQAEMKLDFSIPILYFTQLIGLALGYGYQDLGLRRHFVQTKGLWQE